MKKARWTQLHTNAIVVSLIIIFVCIITSILVILMHDLVELIIYISGTLIGAGALILTLFQVNPFPQNPNPPTQPLQPIYKKNRDWFWRMIGGTILIVSICMIFVIMNRQMLSDTFNRPINSQQSVVPPPSDLIHQTPTISFNPAQQTPTQSSRSSDHTNPYPPHIGSLFLEDPMTDSSRGNWQDIPGDSFGEACKYEQDGYHVIEPAGAYKPCHAYNNDYSFSNLTFEVQMTILKGSCGGISLRDDAPGTAYYFRVCQDGTYLFRRFDTLNNAPILNEGKSSAIHEGLKQANMIAVVANGSQFDLYINYQKVASLQDNNYSSGAFGVSAEAYSEVIYSNARVWK